MMSKLFNNDEISISINIVVVVCVCVFLQLFNNVEKKTRRNSNNARKTRQGKEKNSHSVEKQLKRKRFSCTRAQSI